MLGCVTQTSFVPLRLSCLWASAHRLSGCWLLVGLLSSFLVPGMAIAQPDVTDSARAAPLAEKVDGRFFEQQVLPLLRQRCFECHSHQAGEASGGLMLDSLAAMRGGGSRGGAIDDDAPQRSWLLRAVTYDDPQLQMPPEGRLKDAEIDTLRRWLAAGAPVPERFRGQVRQAATEDQRLSLADSHWAYQPPQPFATPTEASDETQKRHIARGNDLDRILLTQLRSRGLAYSPRASRAVLVRRLYYDLTGLPPTFDQVRTFEQDPREDVIATQALVDRLLASPRFGERWARYWMDVARYADNKGYVFREDREYPEAFKYRDWLIRAFNQDLPYDRFVELQLAADVVASDTTEDLPALGFLTLGRRFLNNKFDIIDDRLDVVSRGLMGMTLACARCHDHKYDPLSQKDYYALFGVFLNSKEPGGDPWPHRLQDAEQLQDAYVLLRGSPGNRGPKVQRRFVSFLARDEPAFSEGSGRVDLARRIAATDNPLTARVMANRVWMRLTGQSLVDSPSDFGTRCPAPVQQPLLDQLAIELMHHDWSLKSLVRKIVLTECYAQDSRDRPAAAAIDPVNAYYWRMNRRRLDFEALRDTLLATCGQLDSQLFGPAEKIDVSPFPGRRTVYAYIDRQNLPSLFRTFDVASPDTHSPGRPQTSVPQQGLFMLNSEFVASQADLLAARLRDEAARSGTHSAIDRLFTSVLARLPTPQERAWFDDFVQQTTAARLRAGRHAHPPTPPLWQVGYAAIDESQSGIGPFQALPKWVDSSWRGGAKLPDPELGWCFLTAEGGHPGNDLDHAVVRRWTAPKAGQVVLRGVLKHPAEQGDGVRGAIVVRGEVLRRWNVHHGQTNTHIKSIPVQEGDIIDWVADCHTHPSHDSFEWKVQVRYVRPAGEVFDSAAGFPKRPRQSWDVWAQLTQALLASNELAFVD